MKQGSQKTGFRNLSKPRADEKLALSEFTEHWDKVRVLAARLLAGLTVDGMSAHRIL
jgi:hypothetical protein